ncbi:uncharacterized protein B0T15DRAFT_79164 [Chaetomium strumarium]|uniref:Uncharacterized protein n=1 Tax=Chaetomium strumarium TaxID=1170767 RepID=A0AAJ0H4A7_9PEZI|nr:hypothetical protein B0T15DRAFT_79164 [Chaetomium strumarium]
MFDIGGCAKGWSNSPKKGKARTSSRRCALVSPHSLPWRELHPVKSSVCLGSEVKGASAHRLALSYIIAVNAGIVADTGGTCVCNAPPVAGQPPCLNDTEYNLCAAEIKKDLVTATAAIAALGTFCMGLFANMYVHQMPDQTTRRDKRY